MTKQTRTIIACAALAGLLAVLSGCKSLVQVSSDGRLIILKEPKSQVVPVGGTATFSVVAKHTGPSTNALAYQWKFNGVNIARATNPSYSKANVQFTDVGQYDVLVSGSQLLSYPANLAVYSGVGTQGTWQAPIGWFTNESSFSCPWGGTFDKGYYPLDTNA